MTFFNKLKWILGILLVFVLIVTTNLIDRNNFVRVRDSVVTLYEDRLLAKGLIFDMSNLIQEKELALVSGNEEFFQRRNTAVNEELTGIVLQFEETKLTYEEQRVFWGLRSELRALREAEVGYEAADEAATQDLQGKITTVRQHLSDLSRIQLSEGRRQMKISKKAVDTVELFTQLEIYLLVFLAIVIQVIVMYNPKKSDE